MKVINLTLNSDKNIIYVFSLTDGDDIEKRTAHYLQVETYTQQNLTGHLLGLCFQSFIKLFSLYQKKGEITMSKENAKKFCELIGNNPAILKECEKYGEGQTDIYEIYSELAKAKGFDCTASELKDYDLAAASGGGKTEQVIIAGLSALNAFGASIMNFKDKDGNINLKDPSIYMASSMAAIGAGFGAWMNYGNNGGNANANGNDTQK